MTEMCDIDHGTTVKAYSWTVKIWNTAADVLEESAHLLSHFGSFLGVYLPSGAIFPLYDSTKPLTRLVDKRFYAVRLSLRNPSPIMTIFGLDSFDITLPRKELTDVWRDLIAPYDIFLESSENYLYNVGGVVQEGYKFNPVRKFGVFSDGVEVALDLGILYLIMRVMRALGLSAIVSKIIVAVMTYCKNRSILNQLSDIADGLDLSDLDDIETRVKAVQEQLGVRLLLR